VSDPFLTAIENLSRFHREHEKFYAQAPRAQAVVLQRHARTLCALADRWSQVEAAPIEFLNPYEGAEDLNAGDALQLDGVLFMEGEGEPVEMARLTRDLRTIGDDSIETGAWLAVAMEGTWDAATALLGYPDLADVVGDRHRIIANDWQAASMSSLAGRLLHRAVDIIDQLDLSPGALRSDLAGPRASPRYLYSAGGADRPGVGSVERLRRTRPRQRATLACLPPASDGPAPLDTRLSDPAVVDAAAASGGRRVGRL
jgi:hypothetical protein